MKLKFLFIPAIIVFVLVALAKADLSFKQSTPSAEKVAVQKTVELFFEGFHKQDSTIIKKTVHPDVRMQSIGKNQMDEIILSDLDFSGFLASICSIPAGTSFEERIKKYDIKMDGKMANVWTPYEFYINGKLSHCGVNSFQLFQRDGQWRIFYIVDTRNKEGCGTQRG